MQNFTSPQTIKWTYDDGMEGLGGMGQDVSEKFIVIGGADGVLKLYTTTTNNNNNNNNNTANEIQEETTTPTTTTTTEEKFQLNIDIAINSVSVSPMNKKEVCIGLEDGSVHLYSITDTEFVMEKLIFRAAGCRICDIQYSSCGTYLGIASQEPRVVVVDVKNPLRIIEIDQHDGGVKALSYDPLGDYLVTCGFDGALKIHKIDVEFGLDSECVFEYQYFQKHMDASDLISSPKCKPCWHPKGLYLAIPFNKEIVILSRENWKEKYLICSSDVNDNDDDSLFMKHEEKTSMISWSKNGTYIAVADMHSKIIVWEFEENKAIQSFFVESSDETRPICDLLWTSNGKSLAVLDMDGKFGIQENALALLSSSSTTTTTTKDNLNNNVNGKIDINNNNDFKENGGVHPKDFMDDDVSVDNHNNDSNNSNNNDDDVDDAQNLGTNQGDMMNNNNNMNDSEDRGIDLEDDDENIDDRDAAGIMSSEEPLLPELPVTAMQLNFQPSSTETEEARYLCWNTIGTIVSHTQDDHNLVEITFSDVSKGSSVRFTDQYKFSMGALGDNGAIFASQAIYETDDENKRSLDDFLNEPKNEPSALFFKPFKGYSAKNQWTRTLPKDEDTYGVAIGDSWVAVGTSKNNIRIFTHSGLQEDIVKIHGPLVTMVGQGPLLAIVYHVGQTFNECQNIGYKLLDVVSKKSISSGYVSLSPGAMLKWAGFSENNMFTIMDDEGVVTGLTNYYDWQWSPLLNTSSLRKNKADSYWPIGVSTDQLICVPLKGYKEYPEIYPKPVISCFHLQMPLISHADKKVYQLENKFALGRLLAKQKEYLVRSEPDITEDEIIEEITHDQAALDTTTIKLMQAAGKNDHSERFIELAWNLNLEKSFTIAIKLANHVGLTKVASTISDIMEKKFPIEDDLDLVYGYDNNGYETTDKENNRNNNLSSSQNYDNNDNSQVEQHKSITKNVINRIESQKSNYTERQEETQIENSQDVDVTSTRQSGPADIPVNPFAKKSLLSPSHKRKKTMFESFSEMAGSPSPKTKKPTLQRTSTFAQEARTKKK